MQSEWNDQNKRENDDETSTNTKIFEMNNMTIKNIHTCISEFQIPLSQQVHLFVPHADLFLQLGDRSAVAVGIAFERRECQLMLTL
jgi:hypothetical protein